MSETILWGALVMGIAGSVHCVGMCGGLASATARSVPSAAAYHLTRVGGYATLGALVGGAGGAVPGPGWLVALPAGALVTWHAAALAGWVHAPHLRLPFGLSERLGRAGRRSDMLGAVALGAATSLLPCGLLYGALGLALGSGSALMGAAVMITFGAATTPVLAVASTGLRRWATGAAWRRQLVAAVVLITGLASLGFRSLAVAAPTDDTPIPEASCH